MRIAVPVTASTMKGALSDIDAAASVADTVELRIDYFVENPDLEELIKLCKKLKKDVVVTNRHFAEAAGSGGFRGSESQRLAYLRGATALGADYVDIEERHSLKYFLTDGKPPHTKIIGSWHDPNATPDGLVLEQIHYRIVDAGADVTKIVTMANSYRDSLRMLEFVAKVSGSGGNVIAFCMGAQGIMSRIFSPLCGGLLTFGSLSVEKSSAPGQIPAAELRSFYNTLKLK